MGLNPGGSLRPRGNFYSNSGRDVRRYVWAASYALGQDVVDVGCGHGYGSNFIAESGARSVLGIDVDEAGIRFAKRHYKRNNLSFAFYPTEDNPSQVRSFDLAILFEVLEHVSDPVRLLADMALILRSEGRLLLSTPNRFHTELMYLDGRSPNPFHLIEYYPDQVLSLLANNFVIEGVFVEYSLDDLNRTKASLENVRRLASYNRSCRVPPRFRRAIPKKLKLLWLHSRGFPTARSEDGMWGQFRIDQVEDLSKIDYRFEVQLYLCRKKSCRDVSRSIGSSGLPA